MMPTEKIVTSGARAAALEMGAETFRAAGHRLVEQIAELAGTACRTARCCATRRPPPCGRHCARTSRCPKTGPTRAPCSTRPPTLLFDHSLFNGHPRFFGYITSSPAPIGALADLLGVCGQPERRRVAPGADGDRDRGADRALDCRAHRISRPGAGGLLVSGGNMANFVCFLAARAAQVSAEVREPVCDRWQHPLRVYASTETHTWIQKAADLFGLGTDAIRWMPVDAQQRMDAAALDEQIAADRANGDRPFLVVGTAGTVSTGSRRSAGGHRHRLPAPRRLVSRRWRLRRAGGARVGCARPACVHWARRIPSRSIRTSGCMHRSKPAVRWCGGRSDLRRAFSYHPSYYHFDHEVTNYFDYGPQNSRGFRALKVWLALRQAGSAGYVEMIGEDMRLARLLHALVQEHPDFEAITQQLSITTFRYVPADLRPAESTPDREAYLQQLNEELLTRVERSGEAFLSNAMVGGRFALRACIVNFRTSRADIEALLPLLARLGHQVDVSMRG